MRRLFALVVLIVVLGANFVVAAESLVGKWNTVDDKSGKVAKETENTER